MTWSLACLATWWSLYWRYTGCEEGWLIEKDCCDEGRDCCEAGIICCCCCCGGGCILPLLLGLLLLLLLTTLFGSCEFGFSAAAGGDAGGRGGPAALPEMDARCE